MYHFIAVFLRYFTLLSEGYNSTKGLFIWRRVSPLTGLELFADISRHPKSQYKFWYLFIWEGGVARLARSHRSTGEISVGGMKISPYEHSIPAAETKMSTLLMRCISKQWTCVSFSTRFQFLSQQTGWNFCIWTQYENCLTYPASLVRGLVRLRINRP